MLHKIKRISSCTPLQEPPGTPLTFPDLPGPPEKSIVHRTSQHFRRKNQHFRRNEKSTVYRQVCYFEEIEPGERSHEQELELSRRSVQFLALESLCSPSYEGLKVTTKWRGDDYIM